MESAGIRWRDGVVGADNGVPVVDVVGPVALHWSSLNDLISNTTVIQL